MKKGDFMKVSLVIPAYNESDNIRKVIDVAKKVNLIDEIVVVDDGSTDDTYEKAISAGVKVFRHEKNKGKGEAIRTGIRKSKGDVILFLDADIKNISAKKIALLIKPILNDEADFVKAAFTRKRGRLTEILVKPLMRVVFPGIEFSQPLSGQFCAKRKFLEKIKIEPRWGIDIGILLDAIKERQRIKEVEIGTIIHKKRPPEDLIKMGEDVVKTIFNKAGDVKDFLAFNRKELVGESKGMIAFDLDKTLVDASTIEIIARRFGFFTNLLRLRMMYWRKRIEEYEITSNLAILLKGKKPSDIEKICEKISLKKNAKEVIQQLKKRNYITAIISSAFSPITEYFAKKLDVDDFMCPELITKKGRFTGEVEFSKTFDKCCYQSVCKKKALKILAKKYKMKLNSTIAVGNSENDIEMLQTAGLGIALKGNKKLERVADVVIKDLTEILLYVD